MLFAGVIVITCAAVGGAWCDDDAAPFTYTSFAAIGAHASSVSGIGMSIGYHLPNPVFFRVSGGSQTIDHKNIYSVGAELQYDLSRGRFARFYVLGGGGVYRWTGSYYNAFGVGIGGEVALGYMLINHLCIGGNLYPMVLYDDGTNSEVHPGASVYFAFNF